MKPIIRAFCVGQAKSGTASLAGLLSGALRVAHEPERPETLDLILRQDAGILSDDEVARLLRARDQRLSLDVDVAWANQFLLRPLLSTFPDASFIVLVRDPWTWLRSIVGHLYSRDIPGDVQAFLQWWFRPGEHPHAAGDAGLKAGGTFSAASFLAAWSRHVNGCLDEIPESRRLVVRTHELPRAHAAIAELLGVSPDEFSTDLGHRNRSTFEGSFDEVVSPAHVDRVIEAECGDALARVFPEVSSRSDAMRLWST